MRAVALFLVVLSCLVQTAWAEPADKVITDFAQLPQKEQAFLKSLDYKRGKVSLGAAPATLDIGPGFFFLDAKDARTLLVDGWSNPAAAAEGALGMVFPAGRSPLADKAWGSVVSFSADGYISDEDAAATDFDALLVNMKEATAESSKQRVAQGSRSIELVGWASPPFYDATQHKLHWARDLVFGGGPDHTVNYAVRALGREGVLEMNFVAPLDVLPEIKAAMPQVLASISYQDGHRYADVQPDDKRAAYGIAALIGGAAAAKLAAKAGLLVVALAYLKKGWILLALGGAALVKYAGRLFGRKPPEA